MKLDVLAVKTMETLFPTVAMLTLLYPSDVTRVWHILEFKTAVKTVGPLYLRL